MTPLSLRLTFLLTLFTCTNLLAQPAIEEQHGLKLVGKVFDQSIKLRWAPTSMYAWKSSNEVGYTVERFTVRRGDEILSLAERQKGTVLTKPALKPWTEEADWLPLMEKNDYAAIAAQALYGASFAVSGGGNALADAKNDQLNRFSFGLFSADQSLEVAEALGLYLEDETVVADEYYLYKVYPTVANEAMPVDTGYLYLGTNESYNLPKIIEVQTEFQDQVAFISWDKVLSDQFYSSFIVERSVNDGPFEAVNALPYVGMDKEKLGEHRVLMMDSLASNDEMYAYRIKGKTIFEEIGPASDPSKGMGVNAKVAHPNIVSVLPTEQNHFGIGWDFLTENESEIAGFQLKRATNDQGPFELISGIKIIDKKLRYFIDEDPLPVNYYKITAIDKYDREINSFAALAQLDDETPPSPPINLRGTVMEDGELLITWSKNTEADVMGYRVYLANRKNREEYVQLTSKPVQQNFYSHLVEMNTLSEEIFVKVRAIDFRQNKSDFSEIVTVMRPDSIPPAAPIFTSARPTTQAVNIIWENSASADVVQMILERKSKSEKNWTAVHTMNYPDDLSVKSWQDKDSKRGELVQYRLKAIDDAELFTFSRIISASKIDNGIRLPVEKVNIKVDRKKKVVALNWNYVPDGNDLSHFIIYRSALEERPGKYDAIKKVAAKRTEEDWGYEDRSLQMDTAYNYQVRAVYANGAQSPLSTLVTINY